MRHKPNSNQETQVKTIKLNVAENATRFAFDEAPVHEDGLPAYDSSFITQGYTYEYGTLMESTLSGVVVSTTQFYDLGDAPGCESW